jgi:hypothetical protein
LNWRFRFQGLVVVVAGVELIEVGEFLLELRVSGIESLFGELAGLGEGEADEDVAVAHARL